MSKAGSGFSQGSITLAVKYSAVLLFVVILLYGGIIMSGIDVRNIDLTSPENDYTISGEVKPITFSEDEDVNPHPVELEVYEPPPMFDAIDGDASGPDLPENAKRVPSVKSYSSTSEFLEEFEMPIPIYKPEEDNNSEDVIVEEDAAETEDVATSIYSEWGVPIPPYKPYAVTERYYRAHSMPAVPRAEVLVKNIPANTKAKTKSDIEKVVPEIPKGPLISLTFAPGGKDLSPGHKQTLNTRITTELKQNSQKRVQIRAYSHSTTKGLTSARRLALERALNIRRFLIDNNIEPHRMDIRAFGQTTDGATDRVDMMIVN